VVSREAAFHYVEGEIAALARTLLAGPADAAPSEPLHIVDLGCGVGASLCYLASQLPMRGTGVTLSPIQVEIAAQRIAEADLSSRVVCVEGDYSNLPPGVGTADLAYAIESFVHAPSPGAFFDQCHRLVRPGGLLVICDDVRGDIDHEDAGRTIDEFCRGW